MASRPTKKSTNVRFISLLRTGFRCGELVSPTLAARALSRLWFRIPPPPPAHRGFRSAPAGSHEFQIDCLGGRVWGYDWGTGPLVYLLHGWGGRSADLEVIAASAVANGFRVIAVDAPSHGNSAPGPFGPAEASPAHFSAALAAAVDKFGPAHAVVAHSMGSLATVTALRETVSTNRLVLVAPFPGGPAFTRLFADQLAAGRRTFTRFISMVEARTDRPLSYFDVAEPAVGVPTLIVHDRGDRSTPFQHSLTIAGAWPDAQVYATEGLGHRTVLRAPDVIGRIAEFLRG
jgi:pimeloyl-ACP methyl ester carboxylesterase